MAQAEDSVITHHLSRRSGDIIVFSLKNKYINNGDEQRQSEQQATIYGKSILDVDTRASADKAAYQVAVADLLQAPDIEKIDFSLYHGAAGDKIYITISDEYHPAEIQITIFNPDDSIQEQGGAVPSSNDRVWIYTVNSGDHLPGDKIVISAKAFAENKYFKKAAL